MAEVVIGGVIYSTTLAVYELIAWGVVTVGMALAWGWLLMQDSALNDDGSPKTGGSCPAQQ